MESEFNAHYEGALRKLIKEKEKNHGAVAKVEEPKEAEVIDLTEAPAAQPGRGGLAAKAVSEKAPAKTSTARKSPAKKRA